MDRNRVIDIAARKEAANVWDLIDRIADQAAPVAPEKATVTITFDLDVNSVEALTIEDATRIATSTAYRSDCNISNVKVTVVQRDV